MATAKSQEIGFERALKNTRILTEPLLINELSILTDVATNVKKEKFAKAYASYKAIKSSIANETAIARKQAKELFQNIKLVDPRNIAEYVIVNGTNNGQELSTMNGYERAFHMCARHKVLKTALKLFRKKYQNWQLELSTLKLCKRTHLDLDSSDVSKFKLNAKREIKKTKNGSSKPAISETKVEETHGTAVVKTLDLSKLKKQDKFIVNIGLERPTNTKSVDDDDIFNLCETSLHQSSLDEVRKQLYKNREEMLDNLVEYQLAPRDKQKTNHQSTSRQQQDKPRKKFKNRKITKESDYNW